ncbi:hypothetical protein PSUM_15585 [Pseudomonas umsongensis]|uniref:Uncharacterized protein n=1 Tax=Pseudomonas umsongensis TaxID=198618 RepID=A0ABX4DY39_9PSED|nr:hypothetical protein [Pseudomonas umsongensis]OXR33439.1 hypothetical protein PSUM_15585 [Pseudomonas umsongensis]SDS58290.1 hypothetical protein SAMN04490206_1025 [Pseudomonas umsongensis]
MYDRTSVTGDTLELLIHNQQALRAGLEELSLWIKRQGATTAHENVLSILSILDMNADAIASSIEYLRR